jgi:predicted Zn-dependent protease
MIALVRDRPDAFRGQWHMARMARQANHAQEALKRYEGAMKLWPYRESLAQEAAAYASDRGAKAWSRDVAFYGTLRWPKNVDFYRLLAANAVDLGDTATARTAVQKGLAVKADDQILNDMWRAFGTPAGK